VIQINLFAITVLTIVRHAPVQFFVSPVLMIFTLQLTIHVLENVDMGILKTKALKVVNNVLITVLFVIIKLIVHNVQMKLIFLTLIIHV
jgi:hypothetical protein